MHRIIKLLFLSLFLFVFCENSQGAWWSRDQNLVTINGSAYTAEDYMHWWENRSEKHKNVSHDIQTFIEWKLLVQEAVSMELDLDPSLQREIDVYMKVRRRLLFKNETIDSKINISEKDLKDIFQIEYSPVSYVTILYFRSEEKAQEAYNSLLDKSVLFADLQIKSEEDGGPFQSRQRQLIPLQMSKDPELQKIIEEISEGEVSPVFPMGHFFTLVHLDKQEIPGEDFFENYKASIKSRLYKERSSQLTSALIKHLWQKYEVQVNEDLFSQVNVNMTGEILNQPIFTTNKTSIPVSLLVKDIGQEYRLRDIDKWTDERKTSLYRGLLNGMIIEYLITWESMERHYEDIPPFKWTYEYFKEATLIEGLEKLLIKPNVSLPESEIESFYQENIADFKNPDLVTIAMIEDERKLVEKMWQEIKQGNDFLEVTKRYYTDLVPVKDVEVEKLTPELASVVQKLEIGEVAPPFEVIGDRVTLVKLLDRKPGEPEPLQSVRDGIVRKLKPRKYRQLRKEYIEKVKANSQIEINQRVWDKLIADQIK